MDPLLLIRYSQLPTDRRGVRGLTDSVEAVAGGLGHVRRFARNSGQRGFRRTGSHGRNASGCRFWAEQREPKTLELARPQQFWNRTPDLIRCLAINGC